MANWRRFTGCCTKAAYELTKNQVFYEKNAARKRQYLDDAAQADQKLEGRRFGDHAKTRDIMDNEFEAIFAGQKTASRAWTMPSRPAMNCC